ncbi:putative ATP-dependent RNA helicase ddx46 [Dermatophagoides pteronyssinus]|uniref:RNA helicase n=1 Tax=Dermatophagoides pteronyssinus TaxID=6956 RepID=A0ABQ8JBP5_DERPT|nr:putative ATP-dependent RNA helicase ddx46 [Dermatophagoides pteronyssinus]
MGRHWDSKRSRSRSPSKSTSSSSVRSSNHRDRDYKSRSSSHRYESSKFSSSRRDKDHHSSSRHRSRSRSPERHRDHHHRSRSPSHHKSKRSSKSPERVNRERVEDIIGQDINYKNFDMDEQQKRLEKIMQERRERIEKWRQQQKLGESSQINTNETSANDQENVSEDVAAAVVPVTDIEIKKDDEPKKTWTLDDENDDDEDDENVDNVDETVEVDEENFQNPTATKVETEDKIEEVVKVNKEEKSVPKEDEANSTSIEKMEIEQQEQAPDSQEKQKQQDVDENNDDNADAEDNDDDIDPLDAYMQGIQEEVKKYRQQTVHANKRNDKVTVVVGVAKQKSTQKKGELIEQNQDAMEYSSGDEISQNDELANAMDNLQAKVKQKKLMTISKEDITYVKFRKNFYIEVPEITKMTDEEVNEYKTKMEGIKTKGKGCPRPIKSWAQCGTSKKVLEVLKRNNYEKPTPIQCQAIPAIMSGRDLIGIAKTGSGKTLAFLLPMFRHIMDQPPLESGDGPISVIMTPTRELATQIYSECRKFAKPLGLRVVAVYGGTPISEQIGDLKPGAEIVVCTPGRMIDMLAANNGRVTNLRRCTYVVLDEADRMFDMGFEPQVMRIIDGIRPDRQTVMFSATFPRIMEALARRILDKPIEVQVGGRSVVCKEVQQEVIVINEDDKFLKLLQILGKFSSEGSAIVFVDKQEHADMLLKELMHASYTCLALHGGIDQNDRDSTIADFKNGRVNVLVATSVAARGLDVKHCIVVINYDCPNHYEDYVHRCGRTGRAGNNGYAYTFITPEQGRYSNDLIKALTSSGNTIPESLQKLFDDYKSEQEMMGKKVKSSSGFTGKGFKFDEAEAIQAAEKKKFQKAALGLQDSDDEDPEEDIDQEIESMLAPKKKTIMQPLIPTGEKTLSEKLELAKQLASKISMTKTPVMNPIVTNKPSATAHTEAILKGDAFSLGDIASAVTAKSIAEQRAELINAKLNYIPKDFEYNDDGEIIKRDDDDLFAQTLAQPRWRVTSKEAIAMISEYSEAGITVRGTYFPPGKEPKVELGERKLYLAIEGVSERSVSKAKSEIIRLIKEELIKLNNTSYLNKSRYRVV